MDFIANRIQLKIAWLSYVVIQSHFFTNKVDSNGGMWRERRREGSYWKYFLFARILSQYIIREENSD